MVGDWGHDGVNDRPGSFKASIRTQICASLWNVDLQLFIKLGNSVTADWIELESHLSYTGPSCHISYFKKLDVLPFLHHFPSTRLNLFQKA